MRELPHGVIGLRGGMRNTFGKSRYVFSKSLKGNCRDDGSRVSVLEISVLEKEKNMAKFVEISTEGIFSRTFRNEKEIPTYVIPLKGIT